MASIKDGGAAFPRPASEFTASGTCSDGNDPVAAQTGMSLRDWFAGMALQGMISSSPLCDRTDKKAVNKPEWARQAYKFADAMLDERNAVE